MKEKKRKITLSTWWQNFLTGVLATAIGVGLTFEVNNRVEHYKQKQAQRQAAMMAIYDVDQIISQFIRDKQREDAFFRVAMYLYTHQDQLETVAMDSLWMAAEYVVNTTEDTPDWADDSTEKVFTGSMDALQNLGDITFYDNVQECYHLRRDMLNRMSSSYSFCRPVPEKYVLDYRKQVSAANMDYTGMMNQSAMAGLLRQIFRMPEVSLYLQKYLVRDRDYQYFINQMIFLNQENKFIMNVTDEDLQHYIDQHINKTMPAKPKLLVGQWDLRQDNKKKTYLIIKDHSATTTVSMDYKIGVRTEGEHVNVPIFTPLTYSAEGSWSLDGDSLRFDFDPNTLQILSFDIDLNNLPNRDENVSDDSIKLQYEQMVKSQLKERTNWSWTNKVSLGKTGKVMFWEEQYTMPWGEVKTDKTQLLKSR